jgi:hypothetical protein
MLNCVYDIYNTFCKMVDWWNLFAHITDNASVHSATQLVKPRKGISLGYISTNECYWLGILYVMKNLSRCHDSNSRGIPRSFHDQSSVAVPSRYELAPTLHYIHTATVFRLVFL